MLRPPLLLAVVAVLTASASAVAQAPPRQPAAAAPAQKSAPPPPSARPPAPRAADEPTAPAAAEGSPPTEVVTTSVADAAGAVAALEVFPFADRVWLRGLDLRAEETARIDAARKGVADSWFCTRAAPNPDCKVDRPVGAASRDDLLVAIRLKVPSMPTPITVWLPPAGGGPRYNPKLVGHQIGNDARWTGFFPPNDAKSPARPAAAPPPPVPGTPPPPPPREPHFEGELQAFFRWPGATTDFQYVTVVDACDNAVVTRFRHDFAIPIQVEESESCSGGTTNGPLKVFPSGAKFRVTAFNLDRPPTRGNVMSTTYVADIAGLDGGGEAVPILVPDPQRDEIRVDCTPRKAIAAVDKGPGRSLAGGSFVVSPDPLHEGRCRIIVTSPLVRRLATAPVVLRVFVERVDVAADSVDGRKPIAESKWLLRPGSHELAIPALPSVSGDARLRIVVVTDPLDPASRGVFYSDAVRLPKRGDGANAQEPFRRELASANVTTAPLCGTTEMRTLDETGSCLRVYLTVPVAAAIIQLTRAPWAERPIVDTSVPGGIGLALAFDSYDPARQRAFPVALQLGGLYERITTGKSGMLTYLAIAPSLPFLGSGGSTTSVGMLAGVGFVYIVDANGPNEGMKPAAFVSIGVNTGQVTFPAATTQK